MTTPTAMLPPRAPRLSPCLPFFPRSYALIPVSVRATRIDPLAACDCVGVPLCTVGLMLCADVNDNVVFCDSGLD